MIFIYAYKFMKKYIQKLSSPQPGDPPLLQEIAVLLDAGSGSGSISGPQQNLLGGVSLSKSVGGLLEPTGSSHTFSFHTHFSLLFLWSFLTTLLGVGGGRVDLGTQRICGLLTYSFLGLLLGLCLLLLERSTSIFVSASTLSKTTASSPICSVCVAISCCYITLLICLAHPILAELNPYYSRNSTTSRSKLESLT